MRELRTVEIEGKSYFGPFALLAGDEGAVRLVDSYDEELAEVHEELAGTVDFDVRFFVELAECHPGPVLELGCGGGRLTLPLASTGRRVEGRDRSAAALTILARRLAHGERAGIVDVRREDLFGPIAPCSYGTIVVAAGMFSTFLRSGGDAWLARLREGLSAGGSLCFDTNEGMRGSGAIMMSARSVETGAGRGVVVVGSMALDAMTRVTNTYFESATQGRTPLLASETVHDEDGADLRQRLNRAGFDDVTVCALGSGDPPPAWGWCARAA